jgi:hypothetical protein
LKYETSIAFRAALEDRLLALSQENGNISRLRKQVAFERLLKRFEEGARNQWILKGGFALELRLGKGARATKDIDVDWRLNEDEMTEVLLDAATLNLDDYFEFELTRVEMPPTIRGGGQRWRATARLAGRLFEQFLLDVGFSTSPIYDPETLRAPELLSFAGIDSATIPAVALEQHIADKVHAYCATHGNH